LNPESAVAKSSNSFDLVVIGGAASGATMALRMARAGWRVAVVEKARFPRRKVCGEYLSATNLPLFEDLGIKDEILGAAGPPVDSVAAYQGESIITAAMPKILENSRLRGIALGRDQLDSCLMRHAKGHGAHAFQPARVTALEREGRNTRVVLETGDPDGCAELPQSLVAPVVVAAHGSWGASSLPSFPKAPKPSPGDLFGFKAHFSRARLPGGLMPLFVFPGGYGGLVETHDGLVSFSCCVRRKVLSAIRARYEETAPTPGEAVVAHLIATVRGMREVLGSAETEGSILYTGPIRPGIRKGYENGVFKVGNAAGEAHPIIAEGITMAMQSSWILSEEWIAAGQDGDPENVAKQYRKRWNRSFQGRIRASFLFAAAAMNPGTTSALRSLFQTFPGLLTLGAELSGKAKVVVR